MSGVRDLLKFQFNNSWVNILCWLIFKGTLKDKINKDGPINEKLVKMYTRQILEGLVYLHSNNLIHRDVKGSLFKKSC